MHRIAARVSLALIAVWMLSGSKYQHHHITSAPVVDHEAPFYGRGLVIGPEVTLPGVRKRVPIAFQMYKFLMRKGDTQYVPGLRREADCSLTEAYVDLADYTIASTHAHFERDLRAAAGLTGAAGGYPDGCTDPILGAPALNLAGGRQPSGTLYGAGPDFHTDGAIALYLSDGTTLIDHHDLTLVPEDSNAFIDQLVVADFNGDGNPDYAVAIGAYGDGALGRIAVLLGDGSGNYAAPLITTVATPPPGMSVSIAGYTVADFDGDGLLDLFVSAGISNSVPGFSFLHGRGDGTFDAPVSIASDPGYGAVLAADFTGDGILDIACGDGTVLVGDGAGHFAAQPGPRFDAGVIASGDFNNDGKADLVVLMQVGDGAPLAVWLGDGTGHFTRGPSYGTGYGAGTADLVVSDLDGDGNDDVLVGSSGGGFYGASINSQGQTQILLGRGDGTLASPPLFSNAVPALADFDGDGHVDLIALETSGTNGVHALLGDGQGNFHNGPSSTFDFSFFAQDIQAWVAADFDNDGKADLLAVTGTLSPPYAGTLHVRHGNGDGTFTSTGADVAADVSFGMSGYRNATIPAVADFDGNGTRDLALIGYGTAGAGVYVYHGTGSGSFAAAQTVDASLVSGGNPSSAVVAGDIDGDDRPDLVAIDAGRPYDATPVPGGLRVYRNLGGSFGAATTLSGATYPDALTLGDTNGDGRLDLLVTGTEQAFGSDTLYVYLGNGDGTFQAPITTPLNDIFFGSIVLGDADGDGKADLVVGNCCGLTFASYAKGDGSGHFAQPAILPLTVSPTLLMLADLTGNGRPSLLAGGQLGNSTALRVFVNTFQDEIFGDGFEGAQ